MYVHTRIVTKRTIKRSMRITPMAIARSVTITPILLRLSIGGIGVLLQCTPMPAAMSTAVEVRPPATRLGHLELHLASRLHRLPGLLGLFLRLIYNIKSVIGFGLLPTVFYFAIYIGSKLETCV